MTTSVTSKMLSLPWKVMADPVNAGKHPFHDSRWIATADAQVEMSPHVPNDWSLESGSLIAQVRDGHPDIAAFICKACNGHAELVAMITALIEADRVICENLGSKSDQAMQRIAALDAAESALKNHS